MTKKTDTKIDPELQTGDAPQDGAAINDDDLQDVINNAAASDAPSGTVAAEPAPSHAAKSLSVKEAAREP